MQQYIEHLQHIQSLLKKRDGLLNRLAIESIVDMMLRNMQDDLQQATVTGWQKFEDKRPIAGQDILIVWPSGNFAPEFRRLNEDGLNNDWSMMRWMPIPDYR